MFAFNGQYPGPLIEAARGAEITVAFRNRLPQPTTVHWHGVRLDNRNDGVADLTQPPVPPGGEFAYRLRFPDAGHLLVSPARSRGHPAGAGTLRQPPDPVGRGGDYGPANREAVLMLDDILDRRTTDWCPGAERADPRAHGTLRQHAAGERRAGVALKVARGEVVRFFLTNAASARTFNLSLAGARMKVRGLGCGARTQREEWVESVVIAPAERYVVHVRFERPGTVAMVNRVRGLDHLYGRFFAQVDTLGTVEVGAAPARPDLRRGIPRAPRRHRGGHRDGATSGAGRPTRRSGPWYSRWRPKDLPRVDPAADAARLDLLLTGGVERHHADDELGFDRAPGALDPPGSRHRPGEHGYRLAIPARRAGSGSAWPTSGAAFTRCSTRSTFTASASWCSR